MHLFDERKFDDLNSKIVMEKVYSFERTLHQMEFLFPGMLESDVHELYSSLWKVLVAIIENENLAECKDNYIKSMNGFARKYHKEIWHELTLADK